MTAPTSRLAVRPVEGERFEPATVAVDRFARVVFGGRSGEVVLSRSAGESPCWLFAADIRDALERYSRGEGLRVSIHGRRPSQLVIELEQRRSDPHDAVAHPVELPAPLASTIPDALARLDLVAGERVEYAVRAHLESFDQTAAHWRRTGVHDTSPLLHAEVRLRVWPAGQQRALGLARDLRRGAAGVEAARLTAADLAWLLVPRTIEAVTPTPAPTRARARPSGPHPTRLPLGRDGNGDLVGMPVTQLTSGFVFGRAGYGKSTLLADAIAHLGRHWRGDGLIVIDPHADLIERVRPWLRDRRPVDIDLGDHGQPAVSWNPLAPARLVPIHMTIRSVVNGLAGALQWRGSYRRLLGTAALAVETIVELNRLLPPELAATIFEIVPLLTDEQWRDSCLSQLPERAPSWTNQRPAEAVSGLVSVLEELRREPAAATFFGRSVSTFDPRTAIDSGQVVLIKPGRSVGYLSANLVLAGLVNAALARVDVPVEQRRHVRLVVDELQGFGHALAAQVVTVLEQTRKFGVSFIGANQSPLRLADALLHAALVNNSLLATFALDAQGARLLASHMEGVEWERIVHLAKHRLIASFERSHGTSRGDAVEVVSVLPETLFAASEHDREDLLALPAGPAIDVTREIRERPAAILRHLDQVQPRVAPAASRKYADLSPAERRQLARQLIARGMSQRAVARELGVRRVTLQRWLGLLDRHGRKWSTGRPGHHVPTEV